MEQIVWYVTRETKRDKKKSWEQRLKGEKTEMGMRDMGGNPGEPGVWKGI